MAVVEEREELFRRRQTYREEIGDAIQAAIFSGELKPGDKIVETYWASRLGVSQGPVREAIRDLEGMGLVETVPFKGSRVHSLSKKDIRDAYSVRICLESKSIKDAIQTLNDDELAALTKEIEGTLEEMAGYADSANLRKFTDADARLHSAIIRATGNEVLLRLWKQCNIRNWFMVSDLTDRNSLLQLHRDHRHIAEGIAERNVEKAVSTLEEHLTSLMLNHIEHM